MLKKFFTFDPDSYEVDFFATFKEAKNHILNVDYDDGYPESFIDGGFVIGEVTHESAYNITDEKKNYCACDDSAECDNEDCDPWPYSDEFDSVGIPSIVKVNNET